MLCRRAWRPAAGGFLDTKEHPSKALCSSCGVRAADRVQYPREPRTTSHRGRVVNESKPAAAVPRQDRHVFFWLATASLLVAIFSRAQQILVPLALSVVIAFALSPVVKRIERRLGRAAAIALVAVVALAAVTAFGYLLKHQLVDLSTQMTKYSESMRKKVSALRGPKGGGLAGLSKSMDGVVQQLDERVVEDREARPVKLIPPKRR